MRGIARSPSTASFMPIRPVVTPATARSSVPPVEFWWASMLRARSKTRSRGARIMVASSMSGI
jgi:hypothetical protein